MPVPDMTRICDILERHVNCSDPGPERADFLWLINQLEDAHNAAKRWERIAVYMMSCHSGQMGRYGVQKSTPRSRKLWLKSVGESAVGFLEGTREPRPPAFGDAEAKRQVLEYLKEHVAAVTAAMEAK